MNYWDLSEEQQKKIEKAGVDYDLRACLEYNSQPFGITDIEKVLAVWVGENDGDDWRWVIKLNSAAAKQHKNRYVFLQGGCDYTGWDCQSWATSMFAKTAAKAAKFAHGEDVELKGSTPMQAGLGHMLNVLSGGYMDNANKVYESLVEQIKSTKKKTWHEKMDGELGGLPKV